MNDKKGRCQAAFFISAPSLFRYFFCFLISVAESLHKKIDCLFLLKQFYILMRAIEIQFEHLGIRYAATAEFLPSLQTMIRVSDFYPRLPDHRNEVYFMYNSGKEKMDFPSFSKKQRGMAESMFASICDCCKDSAVLLEMGLDTRQKAKQAKPSLLTPILESGQFGSRVLSWLNVLPSSGRI